MDSDDIKQILMDDKLMIRIKAARIGMAKLKTCEEYRTLGESIVNEMDKEKQHQLVARQEEVLRQINVYNREEQDLDRQLSQK
jgi:hypothetical protein